MNMTPEAKGPELDKLSISQAPDVKPTRTSRVRLSPGLFSLGAPWAVHEITDIPVIEPAAPPKPSSNS